MDKRSFRFELEIVIYLVALNDQNITDTVTLFI